MTHDNPRMDESPEDNFKSQVGMALNEVDRRSKYDDFDDHLAQYEAVGASLAAKASEVGLEWYLERSVARRSWGMGCMAYRQPYDRVKPLYDRMQRVPPLSEHDATGSGFQWCLYLIEQNRMEEARAVLAAFRRVSDTVRGAHRKWVLAQAREMEQTIDSTDSSQHEPRSADE